MIPHAFPFRFVGGRRPAGEGLEVRTSAGDWWSRGEPLLPFLGVEILAQASILLMDRGEPSAPSDAEDPGLRLGGLQDVRFAEPIRPGELLVARADATGRFGRGVKVRATLARDGAVVCEASLLLIR